MFSKGNRYRISFAVEAPPVFKLSHMATIMAIIMATIMAIWDSLKTGGSWERQICKRNSKTLLKSSEFHRDSSLRLKLFAPYGTAERLGGRGSGISAKKIQKCCENCALIRSLKLKIQVFDHNFTRSARIELRFWEVANLEKLNNFCHDHF